MNLNRIDSTTDGRFRISTASGSQYDLAIEGLQRTLRRIPAKRSPSDEHDAETLRRDGETVNVLGFDVIEVGYPARFALSPLSDNGANVTARITTPVTAIVQGFPPPVVI